MSKIAYLTDPRESIVHVAPADLRKVWPAIRPIIDSHVEASVAAWLTEDMYYDIRAGRQYLFTSSISANRGFMVASAQDDGTRKTFWIWFAWCPRCRGALFWPLIVDLAKSAGATSIAFAGTHRHGWARLAKKYYFRPARVIYETEI